MATIAQSISMNAHGGQARVGEGNKTQAIYTLISEQKYQEGASHSKFLRLDRSDAAAASAMSDANTAAARACTRLRVTSTADAVG